MGGFIREVTSAPPCHQQSAVRNCPHNAIWSSAAEVAKVISRYFLPGMFLMAGAAVLASPAIAHHSYSMFDIDKSVQVEGTVKEFQWTNPHTWINLVVLHDGKQIDFPVELGSVTILAKLGWNPRTLQPGDKVSVTVHPLKSGNPGGDFVSLDSGGHNAVKNDGGAQVRLKERAQRRPGGDS
jgi:hypothetical protein